MYLPDAGPIRQRVLISAGMHDHLHANDRAHPHGPERVGEQRRLVLALVVAIVATVAEAAGGWVSNSLALLSDAGHMLADAAAIGLSLFALRVATHPADPKRTYRFHRLEILAAPVHGRTLVDLGTS